MWSLLYAKSVFKYVWVPLGHNKILKHFYKKKWGVNPLRSYWYSPQIKIKVLWKCYEILVRF